MEAAEPLATRASRAQELPWEQAPSNGLRADDEAPLRREMRRRRGMAGDEAIGGTDVSSGSATKSQGEHGRSRS